MYKRVIIKMSGEALKGSSDLGIEPKMVAQYAKEIKEAHDLGVEIGIVVGGGNFWRGKEAEELGMGRAQADYMGMLGTMMNGLALQDALEKLDVKVRVASSIEIKQIAEPYIRRKALKALHENVVMIFVGGTGSPYFSTDSAASLRALEMDAEVILMGKNGVDGVYDKDPNKYSDAVKYTEISHKEVLEKGLKIMDSTAASLCKDNDVDIIVFDMLEQGNIKKAILGKKIGTSIV